jgi:hypothetical protein
MALSTYSDLKTSVASFLHRDDLTTEIDDFIRLAEADMQVRAKLSQWDAEETISLTSGSGSLPADFAHVISVRYGTQAGVLQFLSGEQFDGYAAANSSGEPLFFTIRGANLVVAPAATASVLLQYRARFTALSAVSTSNSLLTLFPDAYLNGALMHAAHWSRDSEAMTTYAAFFEAAIRRIRTYMLDFRFPNGLQMRAA